MKTKIDLEKFICSYVKWNNIQDALKDQGLKCWRGEIVEIPQESEDERIKKEILDLISISGNGNQFEEIKDWLEKQGQQNHANSAKTCKNDTLLDLLNKIPSYITVDGIDYHFVMKKTSIYMAYYACYKGNGEEGRGNAIFGITAHSPIDLLTEMLEILKEKGLL